ncbi:hypothetical protein XVE_0080 [Xanthomonas vesicatoria ATCC 35937]|uniref:Uncharacterized protein n=1 Tax=Xanthomonas vesicatoria ATCC 35937 TaxID=925775 RepID=F0B7N6_9XANT|nr:hypothetical protein XVE_0080 [Xanthomonas vesicatoria ATCC 35937]
MMDVDLIRRPHLLTIVTDAINLHSLLIPLVTIGSVACHMLSIS